MVGMCQPRQQLSPEGQTEKSGEQHALVGAL